MSFDSPVHFAFFFVYLSLVLVLAVMLTVRESFKVSWFECFKNAGVVWLSFCVFFFLGRFVLLFVLGGVVGVFGAFA